MNAAQMPYLAMLRKGKLVCVLACDLDPFQNVVGSSLTHATPFHEVTLKNIASSFLAKRKMNNNNLAGGKK